jgi:transcriptional regulator with XRE-family HTH domain
VKRHTGFAKRVLSLREDWGETQCEFAKRFGVHQRTVSAWERGQKTPSLPHRVILTLLAKGPDRTWFARQAGPKMVRIMDQALKRRPERGQALPSKDLVAIRCELRTSKGSIWSDRILSLPAELFGGLESIACLIIDETAATRVLAAGDIIVLDTSDNGSPDLRPFWDEVVLVEIDLSAGRTLDPEFTWGRWADRLLMGRLRCKNAVLPLPAAVQEQLEGWRLRSEQEAKQVGLRTVLGPPVSVATIGPLDDADTGWNPSSAATYVGHWQPIPEGQYKSFEELMAWQAEIERERLSKVKLEDACRILGRLVGWFRACRRPEEEVDRGKPNG